MSIQGASNASKGWLAASRRVSWSGWSIAQRSPRGRGLSGSHTFRCVARALIFALLWTSWPQEVWAGVRPQAPPVPQEKKEPAPITKLGNRKLPDVKKPVALPVLSEPPLEEELARARVFEEPFVPEGPSSPEENEALAKAIKAYLAAPSRSEVEPFESFLSTHPGSAWSSSIETNLAIVAVRYGYFSKALSASERAWREGRDSAEPRVRALAGRALAERAFLLARLGKMEELETLLLEVEGFPLSGAAAERVANARQSLWLMKNRPEEAFRCGPVAVGQLLWLVEGRREDRVDHAPAGLKGTSLVQLKALARSAGLELEMVKREAPSLEAAPFPIPSVIHLKTGHFATLLERSGNRYRIADPVFDEERWLPAEALEAETSGYFLAPDVPSGYRTVSEEEAADVWGRGCPNDASLNDQTDCEDTSGGGCGSGACGGGMAGYTFLSLLAALRITDSPLGYTPPRGPPVRLVVTYNQREVFQPAVFTYSNLGPKWTFHWLGYVSDDPSDGSQTATVYRRGGGLETYTGFNTGTQSYAPEWRSRAVLARTSASPIVYERRLPDGSVEVYGQPDGGISFPRKVFLTEERDPQGNSVRFFYDFQMRLVAVADALGQVTTITYGSSDPLKITAVTDPFGRTASLQYDTAGRLIAITDVIGLTSSFHYGLGDFVDELTTPYGTTLFTHAHVGNRRWVEALDPLGARERVEYVISHDDEVAPERELPEEEVPLGFASFNGNMDAGASFFWDKRAMLLAPGDLSKAEAKHWLEHPVTHRAQGVARTVKKPLEGRVWYKFAGQITSHGNTDSRPILIARKLDDGSTQMWAYEYNSRGNVTRSVDPLGRETVYEYAANEQDLLRVKQKNGASFDLLQEMTYNSFHEPLTVKDAAGQTTTYTYNTQGQLLTITTPPRSGIAENRTTTYVYDINGYGFLQNVMGPATGAMTSYTYDGYGRMRTVTDSHNYTLTFDYDTFDRITKVTYPDGTNEQTIYNRLDPEQERDRLGRWTHTFYDAVRRPLAIRDSLGQTTTLQWCNCGSLEKVIDPKGNATSWERDVQGRVTRSIRPDGTDATITYENTTSRIKQIRDAKQQVAAVQYFADDNWKQVSYSNTTQPTPTVSFTYDAVYDRLATMTDGTGTTTYTYNPVTTPPSLGAARLASVDGPFGNDVIGFTYDELGRRVGRTINGVALSQTYDALGRMTGETNALGGFTYGYDGVTDRLTSITYPNGQSTTRGYLGTAQGHRLQDLHNKLSGGATLSRFQYDYAADGSITTWTQQTDNNQSKAYDLVRDFVNQLTTAKLRTTDPAPVVLKRYSYGYDKAANRTGEQVDDASTSASVNAVNAMTSLQPGGALRFAGTVNEAATVTVQGTPAQVTASNQFSGSSSVSSGTSTVAVAATDPNGNTRTNTYQVTQSGSTKTLTYDANGSLISDGMRTFEWDGANRLTAVNQGPHRSEFTYDGWGHRVRIVEKDNSVVTSDRRYLWCGWSICEERNSSGSTVTRRFFDQGMQEGGAAFFYARDHLGSIREMTDMTGAIRARYDYDLYGRVTKISGDKESPFLFTGHFVHAPSGLALAPLRAYDPSIGRWISADPLGLLGGLNAYAYVGGMPADLTDSLGLFDPGTWGTVGAALLGGAAQGGAAGTPVGPAGVAAGVVAGAVIGGAIGYWWWLHNPPPPPDPQNSTDGGNESGGSGSSATSTSTTTEQEQDQRQRDYLAYKKRCEEKPPPTCNDPCEEARWELQRDIDCKRMRQEWDDKYWPGRHWQVIRDLGRSIRRQEEWIRKNCK